MGGMGIDDSPVDVVTNVVKALVINSSPAGVRSMMTCLRSRGCGLRVRYPVERRGIPQADAGTPGEGTPVAIPGRD
jgi:hypothetical protein